MGMGQHFGKYWPDFCVCILVLSHTNCWKFVQTQLLQRKIVCQKVLKCSWWNEFLKFWCWMSYKTLIWFLQLTQPNQQWNLRLMQSICNRTQSQRVFRQRILSIIPHPDHTWERDIYTGNSWIKLEKGEKSLLWWAGNLTWLCFRVCIPGVYTYFHCQP